MKSIYAIVGARPQFIKHAAVELALAKYFNVCTVHTGQHFDDSMSKVFFNELGLSKPLYQLELGGGTHGNQTGMMLSKLEQIFIKDKPSAVLVYGDTNSTLAGALAASKLQIPVIHIEAGLRSFNRAMPEEINRVLTDHISQILFCPTDLSINNLKNEGIVHNVYPTGDVMIDMIRIARDRAMIKQNENFDSYYFTTLHRPYNVDDFDRLTLILNELQSLDKRVVFSVHPRTNQIIEKNNQLRRELSNIDFIGPVGYFESLNLQFNASAVITDSGGMQKEAYYLKKKCITIRSETEWGETLTQGWNTLIFNNLEDLQVCLKIKNSEIHNDRIYGDGFSSESIAKSIFEHLI